MSAPSDLIHVMCAVTVLSATTNAATALTSTAFMIFNTVTDASNSLPNQLRSSTATSESTPYWCNGFDGSRSSGATDNARDSFDVNAEITTDEASSMELADRKRLG
jgi:hypothetical protein